jgi:hypothetical protein
MTSNNPAETVAVNALTLGSNSSNFFVGSWGANAAGSTPPAISAATFSGWTNTDNQVTFAFQPLTATLPNMLTLPAETCAPLGNANCGSQTVSTPASNTIVLVVGYFN